MYSEYTIHAHFYDGCLQCLVLVFMLTLSYINIHRILPSIAIYIFHSKISPKIVMKLNISLPYPCWGGEMYLIDFT